MVAWLKEKGRREVGKTAPFSPTSSAGRPGEGEGTGPTAIVARKRKKGNKERNRKGPEKKDLGNEAVEICLNKLKVACQFILINKNWKSSVSLGKVVEPIATLRTPPH